MRDIIQRPDQFPSAAGESQQGLPRLKGLDIRKYLYMIAKRLWLLLLCFMASIVVMLVMMARQVPEYKATAKIEFRRSGSLAAGHIAAGHGKRLGRLLDYPDQHHQQSRCDRPRPGKTRDYLPGVFRQISLH